MPSKSNQPNIQAYEKKNINKMNKIYLKKKKTERLEYLEDLTNIVIFF